MKYKYVYYIKRGTERFSKIIKKTIKCCSRIKKECLKKKKMYKIKLIHVFLVVTARNPK